MSEALAGSSVLALFGVNPIPMGTPDELRKVGVDPGMVGSCAQPNPQTGVRGCPLWASCPFHLQKYGGFKGQGPKNVGYYIKTHEGRQAENFMTCHNFVRVLLARMRSGRQQAEEGKSNAEIVRIIAQEGGMVRQRGSFAVDPEDRRPNAPWAMKTVAREVPKFPRPGERKGVSYEADLWADEMKRRSVEDDFDVEFNGPPPQPEVGEAPDDFTLEMGSNDDPGLAAPVEKKGK